MLKRQRSSAKFKKDYVAFLAILIFFVVVCVEVALAIWLPMQMRSADAWAEHVARQRMIDTFDRCRRLYGKALRKNKMDEAQPEMLLAKETLDRNARFLRTNDGKIPREMVHTLSEDYRIFFKLTRIYFDPDIKNSYYCSRNKLDTTDTIKRLAEQLKVENKK